MAQFNRFAAAGACVAALAMAAAPVAAADLPAPARSSTGSIPQFAVFDADALKAESHRRWRYRDRIDAGDVLAGVLIIGGIAAIANAASKSERSERYRERDARYDREYRPEYREDRDPRRSDGARGIDRAVEICVAEIERDVRIDSVDSVDRDGEGWRVAGTIFNGDRFTCEIGADGRIERVDYGGSFASAVVPAGNQHSDERYRAAWAEVDGKPATAPAGAPQPAYPGGPVEGDLGADAAGDRYDMADTPAG